jgi:flagellar hook-associated protein 2
MTQVTLGNFTTLSNGKNVLFGTGGSGLDTNSVIKSLVAARSTSITQSQDAIKINDAQSAALSTFQSLLSAFQTSADALRNPPGVGNDADNAFKYTTSSVSNGGSSYVSLTTAPGATLQTYNISAISQLATAGSADSSAVSANLIPGSPLQFGPGTFTVNGQAISLTEGDSLNAVAAKFNGVSTESGVSATVVQLQTGQYELSFASTATGAANSFDLSSLASVSDPSHALSNVGLLPQQSTGIFTVSSSDDSVVPPLSGSTAFGAGTIHFNGADIIISAGDSLNAIAESFNNVTTTTGVRAHVIQVATGQFQLSFNADPGVGNFDLSAATDSSGALTSAGITAENAGSAATAGLDAHFKLNGIDIARPSNSADDVLTGVTINLLGTTPDNVTTYAASVKPDTTIVQNTINSFVKAYNDLKTFAATQTQLNSDGTYATTAVLANNQSFRNVMSDITTQVANQVGGITTGKYSSLSDLGITYTTQAATSTSPAVDNILTVNDAALTSALTTNFQQVSGVFGFHLTSNNPNLAIFSETNALGVSNFTLHIDPGTSTFTASYIENGSSKTVNLTAKALSADSYSLTGQDGTALQGLVMIYASNAPATINATATQGIADKIYNTNNAALTANTGLLPVALKALADSDTKLNQNITDTNAQVAIYQQQLIQQYAVLESSISKVNSLLDSLAANDNARLVASGK